MYYLAAIQTDIGTRKKVNQDAAIIKEADTEYGRILLAAICDGMGGLSDGEYASGKMTERISQWFEDELPYCIGNGISPDDIEESLCRLAKDADAEIAAYGRAHNGDCGTTLCLILLTEGRYIVCNVGDTRVYKLSGGMPEPLTKDQTWVQMQVDRGLMQPEEAKTHKQRSVLLQCIGAEDGVQPVFTSGSYRTGEEFLLCCDGFRHVLSEEEMGGIFKPERMTDEAAMREACAEGIARNKKRNEKDNITVAVIKACDGLPAKKSRFGVRPC